MMPQIKQFHRAIIEDEDAAVPMPPARIGHFDPEPGADGLPQVIAASVGMALDFIIKLFCIDKSGIENVAFGIDPASCREVVLAICDAFHRPHRILRPDKSSER